MANLKTLHKEHIFLSTTKIKILAVILMVIDHIGVAFFPDVYTFRIIGRMAFPIFVYLVVQGYFLTTNFNKYALRLFILALISEIPYDFFMYGEWFTLKSQNVCFSLLLVLFFVRLYDTFHYVMNRFLIVTFFSFLAFYMRVDYLWLGTLYAIVFYFKIKINLSLVRQIIFFSIFSLSYASVFFLQPFAVFALIPLTLYNPAIKDDKGAIVKLFNRNKKYYYLFYPIQFVLLAIIYLITIQF